MAPSETPATITFDLPLQDVSGRLTLTEVFASIELEGEHLEITRSLTGLQFYLELDGRREMLDVGPVFKDWSTDLLARVREVRANGN